MPYKEAGGKWRATPHFKGERLKTRIFKTKAEAIDYERQAKKQANQAAQRAQIGTPLIDFCIKYLDYSARYSVKTYKEKRAACQRILEAWGPDQTVELITLEMAQKYLDAQAKNRSSNAANKDRKNLLSMFNKGKLFGVKSNPFAETEPRPHDRQPQYTPPTDDVLAVILAASRAERVFLTCYLQTGARRSEIFRWTWIDDINFERREYRLGTRKTRSGNMEFEWFPMTEDLFEALSWQWENRTVKTSPYVFVNDRPQSAHYGQPYTTRRKFMAGLCRRAGVKPFGFHALRRFVASVLADSGKSSNAIRRILRHKNIRTTELYIQNINNDLKEAMEPLNFKKLHISPTQNKKEAAE